MRASVTVRPLPSHSIHEKSSGCDDVCRSSESYSDRILEGLGVRGCQRDRRRSQAHRKPRMSGTPRGAGCESLATSCCRTRDGRPTHVAAPRPVRVPGTGDRRRRVPCTPVQCRGAAVGQASVALRGQQPDRRPAGDRIGKEADVDSDVGVALLGALAIRGRRVRQVDDAQTVVVDARP